MIMRRNLKKLLQTNIKIRGAFNNDSIEYQSRRDKHKKVSLDGYFNIIRPFLREMVNNHKTHGEQKIQLTMQITFISSLDIAEFSIMHSKGDNAEIMMGIEADDIIN